MKPISIILSILYLIGCVFNKKSVFHCYMTPFGSDASPWCDCQDYPDNYWKIMKIEISDLTLNSATIYWTWPKTTTFAENNNKYHIKLKKENDKWKIAYMDGFDFNSFFQKAN